MQTKNQTLIIPAGELGLVVTSAKGNKAIGWQITNHTTGVTLTASCRPSNDGVYFGAALHTETIGPRATTCFKEEVGYAYYRLEISNSDESSEGNVSVVITSIEESA